MKDILQFLEERKLTQEEAIKILEKNFALGQKINVVKIRDTEIEFLYSDLRF